MQRQPPLFDLVALRSAEDRYRRELQSRADSTPTRLNLAWCLFMEALHASGTESAAPLYELPTLVTDALVAPGACRSAQSLLQECLGHICIAKQLSVHKSDLLDASRLQTLVNLSGFEGAARCAEEACLTRLHALSWEIVHGKPDSDFNVLEE